MSGWYVEEKKKRVESPYTNCIRCTRCDALFGKDVRTHYGYYEDGTSGKRVYLGPAARSFNETGCCPMCDYKIEVRDD